MEIFNPTPINEPVFPMTSQLIFSVKEKMSTHFLTKRVRKEAWEYLGFA
jgi:hypothetical protein